MVTMLLMIIVALATFFFADSILTPLVLLLWKKGWLLVLKIQALLTKKNLLQALVQSLVLTGKALLRLINKTISAWILPLLMTRKQRYWLHHAILDLRRWMRFRLLRGWVRWRRQSLWLRIAIAGAGGHSRSGPVRGQRLPDRHPFRRVLHRALARRSADRHSGLPEKSARAHRPLRLRALGARSRGQQGHGRDHRSGLVANA